MLVTNKSEDDLVHKVYVEAIGNHKRANSNVKPAIKPFILIMAEVTGVPNFGQSGKSSHRYTFSDSNVIKHSQQDLTKASPTKAT
jgi:hypothetical protein